VSNPTIDQITATWVDGRQLRSDRCADCGSSVFGHPGVCDLPWHHNCTPRIERVSDNEIVQITKQKWFGTKPRLKNREIHMHLINISAADEATFGRSMRRWRNPVVHIISDVETRRGETTATWLCGHSATGDLALYADVADDAIVCERCETVAQESNRRVRSAFSTSPADSANGARVRDIIGGAA
jgi:hypothetical protein